MSDYISREAAMEIVKRTSGDYAAAFSEIRKLPAADVEPVRYGRWDEDQRCSECGTPAPQAYWEPDCWKSPYCPECGAKMCLEGEIDD